PRSVAVIGASPHDLATLAHLNTKIRDHLFLINPNYTEIRGRRCHPRIVDVQGDVDYAIVIVAARLVPQILEECIQKRVKVAQIYTAGFSETGDPERIALEKRIQETAAGRIRIIGPNCFGVYCPRSGLAIVPESPEEEGHIGVVAQSGSVVESFSYFARTKGLRFSKVVSYGNAVDLDAPDFLELLARDPDTKIIAFYIEGTRNAGRLKRSLAVAAGRKPVIAIKGGLTDDGMRAARSHTASMTGTPEMWKSLFRQTGVVQVDSFDEMVNAVMAFSRCPLPRGKGVSLITNSGGFSVIQTDLCRKAGLEMPAFSPETVKTLRSLVPAAGTSIGNPLDAWPMYYNISDSGNLREIIKVVSSDRKIHSVIFQFDQFRYLRRALGEGVGAHMEKLIPLMVEGCRAARDEEGKPVAACISLDAYLEDEEDRRYNLRIKSAFDEAGFPVYSNLDAAMRVVSNLYRYTQRKTSHNKRARRGDS
ncbi:MAG TPA: CoA-binding protein, partial [Thermodesulfobacteriota bacterium]|nr:CoA-binding protein [Thermodesulfobacteriota bacterium]